MKAAIEGRYDKRSKSSTPFWGHVLMLESTTEALVDLDRDPKIGLG